MRIAFINSTHRWGGVKTWMLDVGQALSERGHTVTLYGRRGPFVDAWTAAGLPGRSVTFGSDFSPRSIGFFVRAFRAWTPDLILANVGKDLRTAGIAARLCGIPVIHRVGLPGDMRDKWNVRLIHRFLKPSYLVPCEFIKKGLLRELPFLSPEAVTSVHTGKTPVAVPPGQVADPLRLVISSQLSKEKGHSDLFRALARLRGQHRFVCHILGTGPFENQLQDLASELRLDHHLIWHGFQPDVRPYLRQADIFLLPSYREGLPNTLLEAMAEGLIPLARNIGGVQEVWPDSLAPFLLPEDSDPATWAAALNDLLLQPENQLLRYKAASWQACTDNFTLTTQISRLEAWLQGQRAPGS